MREIGSEFWQVETCAHPSALFPEHTQWYLSGRSALKAILSELGGAKTVSMPAWCCDSMVRPFLDEGIRVRFYPVYPGHGLSQVVQADADILFVMDYFGYTSDSPADHPCVIRDVTHSLFSRTYGDARYTFGSLRKWCGVWTGSYAWTGDGHRLCEGAEAPADYIALRREAMRLKAGYIDGGADGCESPAADKRYLAAFDEAEEMLEDAGISTAAERDIRMAAALDAQLIRFRRRENAGILMRAFEDMLVFPELKDGDCPMFVPILVPDGRRDELRRYLIERQIYCPVHWPVSQYHAVDARTAALYRDGLSLVCDQRYTRADMERIVDAIREFMED